MALGLIGGILVGVTAPGQAFSSLGTLEDPRSAYAVPVTPGETLRFQIAPEDTPGPRAAAFALFDGQDAFFGHFLLEGADDVCRGVG
ncbi:MAG: hypothetical protein R3185_02345 [Candidatus Thermoplasmatota archaeon]|nr:hypothetical protein [Candidatus Thermoplasmatota archaeon]